jgi:hypothetical protein
MDEQGWVWAWANDGVCACMPATTPVVAAPSAMLDTPSRHAHLHSISPSNILLFNFNFNFIILYKK